MILHAATKQHKFKVFVHFISIIKEQVILLQFADSESWDSSHEKS